MQEPHESGGTPTVLLVDDSATSQAVFTRMLQEIGCEVVVVPDGAAAVAAAAETRYDAILMDCQMPVMSGYEATTRIRAQEPEGTHVRIIAITASAMPDVLESAAAAGMDDHLFKPPSLAQLEAAVRPNA